MALTFASVSILNDLIMLYETETIIDTLKKYKVSCAIVNDIAAAFDSEEIKALNMITENDSIQSVGKPFHLESVKN
ncbi:MAG: hypothetical protein A2015_17440 [Spirochaetes bacterium GWF1_31_7]|nr:MAG: hypothetical protein A2Y30_05430 [Spirochaetes bacterium GWE1_32_154]OHD46237.1 MAG: hypothetical protein A2Y29_08435 [Spirochaetes bacterium GWE2_31_10]OHD48607.1 MAG: hypothetical protein A2015_17440 [Spirochaetes bacterium GWF1_31_7]OHD81659.1 MAG: hypothetical protein A2355_03755 [Spirochaetes bacterium RIFOXYB1_FULL_32_8]HBD93054.1 hypothetical protein [Spirochaetia bacterium]